MTTLTTDLASGTELGGVAEISELFETKPTNVTTWISRRAQNGFPEPVCQFRMGGLYDLGAVKAWHDAFVGRRTRQPVSA